MCAANPYGRHTEALRSLVRPPNAWRGATHLDEDSEPRVLLLRTWSSGQVDVLEIADEHDAVAYRCAPDDPADFAAVQRSSALWLRTGPVSEVIDELEDLPGPAGGTPVRIA